MAELDPEAVAAAARERTGLNDFGGDDFLAPLAVYLEGLKDNLAAFSPRGVAMAFEEPVRSLESRLRIQDYIARNPAVLDEKISRPVFITGLYRSATTKLQAMLCADQRWQYLQTWMTTQPVPIAETRPGEEDPRIAASRASLNMLSDLAPQAMLAHPLAATDPSEEFPLMMGSFRIADAKQFSPRFRNWVAAQDNTPMYRDLHRVLQVLQFQFKRPGIDEQRYCLKAPIHLGNIDLLLKVFPDAKVIFTHRDPFPAVHSYTMVRESLRGISVDNIDLLAIGTEMLEQAARALEKSLEARASFPAASFLELSFSDIVGRALELADGIYDFVDAPLTAETRAKLVAEDEKRDEHKSRAEKRDPARYGLTRERVHERTSAYINWAERTVGPLS